MNKQTRIEWSDATWNPTFGCRAVTSGCRNCYARRIAAKSAKPGQVYYNIAHFDERTGRPRWTNKLVRNEAHYLDPVKWTKPGRILVDSMSDLFHERIPDEWRDEAFGVMAICGQHDFFISTKRPAVMWTYFQDKKRWARIEQQARECYRAYFGAEYPGDGHLTGPLPNVWLGVSVENSRTANERVPILNSTPAARRWIAVEPLIAPVKLWQRHLNPALVHWVVISGEGGPDARLCKVQWIEQVIDQCQTNRVPLFVKQLGTNSSIATRCEHGELVCFLCRESGQLTHPIDRHSDVDAWPEALRVRDLPRVRESGGHK